MNTFMRGPSVDIGDDDDVVDLQKSSSFQIPRSPSVIRPPSGIGGSAGPNLGTDMLINRRKVSNEVMSLSSSSNDGSEYSESRSGSPQFQSQKPQKIATPLPSYSQPQNNYGNNYGNNNRMNGYNNQIPVIQQSSGSGSGSSDGDDSDDDDDDDNGGGGGGGGGGDAFGNRFQAERSRMHNEMEEKKEILYQMNRLEAKGYKLPRNFTMQSDLEEMRAEYHRIVREKEIDASIRFQRKAMMFAVSGIEFLNTKFDPISAKLDGWSEQVHDTIDDYDDIFEELHDKYKGSGQKMAPELRLLLGVGGSAFMYHLTQSMFKQSKTQLPGVEEVLRNNPELMKQFQAAAVNQMADQQRQQQYQQAGNGSGSGGGLFGMLGNMMNLAGLGGGGGGGPGGPGGNMPMPQMTRPGKNVRDANDIDNIIDDIHKEIVTNSNEVDQEIKRSRQIETMSISDEEITSIIEDTADMNGIMINNGGKRRGKRTGGGAGSGSARTMNL